MWSTFTFPCHLPEEPHDSGSFVLSGFGIWKYKTDCKYVSKCLPLLVKWIQWEILISSSMWWLILFISQLNMLMCIKHTCKMKFASFLSGKCTYLHWFNWQYLHLDDLTSGMSKRFWMMQIVLILIQNHHVVLMTKSSPAAHSQEHILIGLWY